MDRNRPKRTQYKGENVIKQIMSEIFIQSILILSAFNMEIYFVQYIHLLLKKKKKKESEVKFPARQLGLGSARLWLSYPTIFYLEEPNKLFFLNHNRL